VTRQTFAVFASLVLLGVMLAILATAFRSNPDANGTAIFACLSLAFVGCRVADLVKHFTKPKPAPKPRA
jgi:hypothetical protein